MKLSLRQFLFILGLFAILVPIIAIFSYFVSKKPSFDEGTQDFLKSSIIQNSRVFLNNFKETCLILNADIKDSNLDVFEKEKESKTLKNHITEFLENNRFGKNSYYWVVELLDAETSIMRVSNSEIREGSILEMTENIHLHSNFLDLLSRAKNIKKRNIGLNGTRIHSLDPKIFSVYGFIPEFNWLIGISFDMQNNESEASAYISTYSKYHIYNLLGFSVVISLIISVLIFLFVSFISRDLKILQRVLEQLKRGNLTEAKYAFRMLFFDSNRSFMQMNILEMDILEYINDLYRTLQRTKTLSDKLVDISKHSSELLFLTETVIKDQNLSVKQSTLQSDAIVFSANSLNVTALNSSRELLEFLKSSESANESLNKLKASILSLSKASRETSNILEFINGLTFKIKEVVSDINKVSENANLVSFNIAIEAEKVGLEGLALSLLSKEIHSVAVNTKKLTEKIEFSAMDLQDTLNTDLADMAKFSLKMQDTNLSLSSLAGSLGEIVRGVDVLLRGFETLSSVISEQFKEAHKLSTSMIRLGGTGEDLALSMSNFRVENESLMQRSRELKTKVSEFHF